MLVHLVAVTLGCSRSTHLWYSTFHLDELINTYLAGFMVSLSLSVCIWDYYYQTYVM